MAEPVVLAQLNKAKDIAQIMMQFMNERAGVGIAAPQIGVSQQIMIIASRPNGRYPDAPLMEPLVMFNPKPVSYAGDGVAMWEGCLSVPGLRGKVTRPSAVDVEYLNENGHPDRLSLSGFPARIFQHEYDHLIGKTFVDRVASVTDLVTDKVYFQLMAQS